MSYYIHIKDPGFWQPPWPGQRRLGPYDDDERAGVSGVDAAKSQAISDLAQGQVSEENFVGIFDDVQSDLLDFDRSTQMASKLGEGEKLPKVKSAASLTSLKKEVGAFRRKQAEDLAAVAAEQLALIEQRLIGTEFTIEDILAAHRILKVSPQTIVSAVTRP